MTTSTKKRPRQIARAVNLDLSGNDLPDGVCGRITGVALVYGTLDSYDTIFAAGCLDKTRGQRVATGKVQLYAALDNGTHQYGIRSHVGVVRSLTDEGNNVIMVADLFDTPEGQEIKQYLDSVLKAGGQTGLSVGAGIVRSSFQTVNGDNVEVFEEVVLREITITPINAVPGTQVLAVRSITDPSSIKTTAMVLLSLLSDDDRADVLEQFAGVDDDEDDDSEDPTETTEIDTPSDTTTSTADATPEVQGEVTEVAMSQTITEEMATTEKRLELYRKSFSHSFK